MKLTIINSRSFTYPNQCTCQDRFFEIYQNGSVEVDVNAEIGDSIPCKVFNMEIIRLNIPYSFTRKDIIAFYSEHRSKFAAVVAGMDTKWNGNNYVGTLTDDAEKALTELSYYLYHG